MFHRGIQFFFFLKSSNEVKYIRGSRLQMFFKMVFLKILQISQENTSVGVFVKKEHKIKKTQVFSSKIC